MSTYKDYDCKDSNTPHQPLIQLIGKDGSKLLDKCTYISDTHTSQGDRPFPDGTYMRDFQNENGQWSLINTPSNRIMFPMQDKYWVRREYGVVFFPIVNGKQIACNYRGKTFVEDVKNYETLQDQGQVWIIINNKPYYIDFTTSTIIPNTTNARINAHISQMSNQNNRSY
jgi:hypothetical protein